MGKMIGIDLGTTNSVVAIVDGPQPRVLDNREARSQTRSVVGLRKRRGKKPEEAEILVGEAAMDNWAMAPRDTIVSVKRLMGRGVGDPEVQKVREWALYEVVEPAGGTRDSVRVVMNGKEYSPVSISALILKKLKEDAEFRLGEPVTHAVITVPAYFSQIQRDATRRAGLAAEMKVIKILDEPTAAAIAFGMDAGDGNPKTILVYDLGGGTFDISVLMWAGNVFAPLNLEGDMWLGGDNLDQVLVDRVVGHVRKEYGVDPTTNARFMAELKKAAQAVKERLSAARTADLMVTGVLQDADGNLIDVEMEVTREEFERMILHLVGRYRSCSCGQDNYQRDESCARCHASLRGAPVLEGRAVQLVRRALAHPSVNLAPEQVDHVIMAGNSTSLPLVQQTMEEIFGPEKVLRKVHPKHAVALGAAMVATWMGAQCVCHGPDPSDPNRECGQVNKDDATVCVRCGAGLGLPETTDPDNVATVVKKPEIGQIGGIAPFNYGTQTKGDRFNVFIHKGDPTPTADPRAHIHETHVPRQRMVSIPIFGGDNLERASANEKQGEAFAVLPPDLPRGTLIRIKLWLDSDGVFELTAHLDDGTDLKPWLVKGESDAKAIQAIQKIERLVAERGQALSPAAREDVERGRSRILEMMRRQEFDAAQEEAAQIEHVVLDASASTDASSLPKMAENLVRWTGWMLQQYAWGLDPAWSQRTRHLMEAVKTALSEDRRRLQEAYDALDVATANLPERIELLVWLRQAIALRVRTADPGRGADLMRRLEAVENGLRTRQTGAEQDLETFVGEVGAAIRQVAPRGLRCSQDHAVPPGERNCPECGEDTWILDSKSPDSTGGRHG
jgi:molecular chaperone DnaK (HSP70)